MIGPMASADATKLTAEVSLLREKQLIARQNAAYIVMSALDTTEYDGRAARIAEIYQLLAQFEAPTESQPSPSRRAVA